MSDNKLGSYISVLHDVHNFADAQYEARAAWLCDQWVDEGGSISWSYSLFSEGILMDDLSKLFDDFRSKLAGSYVIDRTHKVMGRNFRYLICELAVNAGLVILRTDEYQASRMTSFVIKGITSAKDEGVLESHVLSMLEELNLSITKLVRDDKTPITYAFPSTNGIRLVDRVFAKHRLDDIASNYAPEVVERVREAIEVIRDTDNGVVVLNGDPGTGKTHLLRAILTEVDKQKRGVICCPPFNFLNDVGLLAEATADFASSLVVFEDLGNIITAQASSEYDQIYANLLNVTDGLLSLLSNTVLVLTFNTKIDKIDPAILRPGRCVAQIQVDPLSREQAQQLLQAGGLDFDIESETYTLAEVYEMKRTGKPMKTRTVKSTGLVR